ADFRMAVALLVAGPAQRHRLHDGHIVLDHAGFADHDAGGVIEHDALADNAGRVNIHTEYFRIPTLDEQSEALAVIVPLEVGETVHLDGLEALEKENDRQIGVGGRIPVEHRLNIVSCVDADL